MTATLKSPGCTHLYHDMYENKTPVEIIGFGDSGYIDAFGRLRVSSPQTLFDSKNIFNDDGLADTVENQPLFYDNQQVSGSNTSTAYNANQSSQSIIVASGSAGKRVRQTKMRFNYQPGKSQLVIMTFNLNGGTPSLVVRSFVSGSVVDNEVAQANWNLDKMDGTGISKVNLDLTKTQILYIDYEWLGVGRVRVGFVVDGHVYYAHEFLHANVETTAYMSTPNLPLRSEISSNGSGVYTKGEGIFDDSNGIFLKVVGGTNSITQICSTVVSEGGSHDLGVIRYTSTGGTHVDANTENTLYAVLGIRLKSEYIGAAINILSTALQIQTPSDMCEWTLLFNPTVAGTFNYADQTNSAVQIAVGATANTVTGGTPIAGGFVESTSVASGSSGSADKGIDTALRLGSLISGTVDSIVLCVRPVGGSADVDVEGSMTWRELV